MRKDDQHHTPGPLRLPIRWLGAVAVALVSPPARALRGTARRVGDPARQVADYFRSERRTVRQGFLAVSTASLTSLLAGLTLAAMDHRIRAVSGLFVLIPVSIGMRGNIFGALAARLGTSIHSGLFEVSRRREGILYQNIHAAILLTVATSVTMALLGRGIAASLGIETVSVWDLVVVALAGGLLSSVVVLAVTVFLSITSLRRGWDLDSVGAPLITAIGDVVTLPCLLAASYLVGLSWVTPALGGLALAAALASLVKGWTTLASVTRRVVRQSFPVLCVAIVLDVLAGTVVQPRIESVFLAFPALLMVIPGFLENTGALGSILAARLGSKLHLGAVSPHARPDAVALLDGSIVLVLGITVYAITTIATLVIATVFGIDTPGTLRFIAIVLTGGALATLVASLIGYYAATLSYALGLDPDNYTIPLVTSGMDLIGIICLVAALVVFGVG